MHWLALCLFIILSGSVYGQNRAPRGLDEGLERMAEILGSLHYLDNLCYEARKEQASNEWRHFMDRLILTGNLIPRQRSRLVHAFNRSYRSFSENHHQCTRSAIEATDLYRKEGKILAEEIVNRYGD